MRSTEYRFGYDDDDDDDDYYYYYYERILIKCRRAETTPY